MGKSEINRGLDGNDIQLTQLVDNFKKLQNDELVTINKVIISSYASPESGKTYNIKLTEDRNVSIIKYLNDNGIEIPSSILECHGNGIAWDILRDKVANSSMEQKEEIINIIDNVDEETWARVNPSDKWLSLVDSRRKHLMVLDRGVPYRFMQENFFPQLRKANVVTIYYQRKPEPKVEVQPEPEVKPEPKAEPKVEPQPEPQPEPKALFAIKTNLLFDVASLLNVELEVPIGDRWSIAGEWIFPWWSSCGTKNNGWTKDSRRNSVQLLNGNIEGRYWFGDRTDRLQLTGWFAGVYAGAAKYDFEYKAKGYQGESLISTGLTAGYAHTINKKGNLRMEYSLGVGYMQTDYEKYDEHICTDDQWHTTKLSSGTYNWIGPTRAKISLVWMLNSNARNRK